MEVIYKPQSIRNRCLHFFLKEKEELKLFQEQLSGFKHNIFPAD